LKRISSFEDDARLLHAVAGQRVSPRLRRAGGIMGADPLPAEDVKGLTKQE
jgi:hypothetical protein